MHVTTCLQKQVLSELYGENLSDVFVRIAGLRSFFLQQETDHKKKFCPPPPLTKLQVSSGLASQKPPSLQPKKCSASGSASSSEKCNRHEWNTQLFWRMVVTKPRAFLLSKLIEKKLSEVLCYYPFKTLKSRLKMKWSQILERNYQLLVTFHVSTSCDCRLAASRSTAGDLLVTFTAFATQCPMPLVQRIRMVQEDVRPYEFLCWMNPQGECQSVDQQFRENPILETWLGTILVKQDEAQETPSNISDTCYDEVLKEHKYLKK